MADPLACLRRSCIAIAAWNIIYCLLQLGIMGWQVKVTKDLQWEWENREIPNNAAADGFQARFPGLYGLYTETPERRRVNALFAISITCVVLALFHLPASIMLLIGSIKLHVALVWPWLITALALSTMCTVYAVMWWSGDVFNEQLTVSVAEFILSLAIQGACIVVVAFFVARITGKLTSDKPAKRNKHTNYQKYPNSAHRTDQRVPTWRTEWTERPPTKLEQRLKRREEKEQREMMEMRMESRGRRSRSRSKGRGRDKDGELDFFSPEPYASTFPWKEDVVGCERERESEKRISRAEAIEKLYNQHYPEDTNPRLKSAVKYSNRRSRRSRTPDRVSFSRSQPAVQYLTPPSTVQFNSVV